MANEYIKYIRVQVPGCTIVEFSNGSRACSCGLVRGYPPNLRERSAEERIAAALAVCDEWDRFSKGPTRTTERIREALTNE